MQILSIYIQNFRRLSKCHIDFSNKTTLFVGANNSGKTSAMDALGKFLSDRSFTFNDITISNREKINMIGRFWESEECKEPENLFEWENVIPIMDVWINVTNDEIHYVADIIPTLKWRGGKLGVRLALFPKDISKLFAEYREAYFSARKTEQAKVEVNISLYPKDLCEFLEKNMNSYFSIKSFILNPAKSLEESPQVTVFEAECATNNPLKGIIRVDMIDAQRGFSDPDSSDGGEKVRKKLSEQMRNYYDKHLDPEKIPSPEDLDILKATEDAKKAFDANLAIKFAPAIKELEELGYPGVTDPKITITSKMATGETLKHDSAVQYTVSKFDDNLKLPEKYNGLGYQNLISMVFDLMQFRDAWMREGKAKKIQDYSNSVIEPLHLVLVEEPEAHLHVQVQQVFIRKAYSVLIHNKFIEENKHFTTQLVVSTHSSHIVRETDFADLRYFKRISEGKTNNIATSEVINLSDVFGEKNQTNKFVTRYLRTTHCDLFFADATILVEGAAESMLLPHFIRYHYPKLYQRYISILSINGRHSHRLRPLLEKLCIPTLILTDLDSSEKMGHHKAVYPERGKELISSNYAIAKWLMKENDLEKLLDAPSNQKEIKLKTPYEYSIRIAYQTPVTVNYAGKDMEAISSTFEDCLVYTNYELFKELVEADDSDGSKEDKKDIIDDTKAYDDESDEGLDNVGNLAKSVAGVIKSAKSFEEFRRSVYDSLREGKSDQKAEFALDLIYTIDPEEIKVPCYIDEGLNWLQDYLDPEVENNDR